MQRVEQALKYLPAERITLNPDCGFAPGSAAEVSLDEVYTKYKGARPKWFQLMTDGKPDERWTAMGEALIERAMASVTVERR